jgi:folate-binding protein YgfZ
MTKEWPVMSGSWPVNSALLLDVTDRAQIEVTGRDRVKFLHSFCTNDLQKRQPGQGCEAFVTNVNGKVLGHIFVFLEREALWIDSVPGSGTTLLPHFDRYLITEDVRFADRSPEFAEFLLFGDTSTTLLEQLGLTVGSLPLYGHLDHGSDVLPVRSVRRVDWLGGPTWLLQAPIGHRGDIVQRLSAAGAAAADLETFHALRIMAGFPLYGSDITDDNLAQEVGRTAQAISFTKGCYLGQEPIARIDALGHVNRQLCRLVLPSQVPPLAGTPVHEHATPDAKAIGAITSSALDLNGSQALALAYLRSPFVKSGTEVFVSGQVARVL